MRQKYLRESIDSWTRARGADQARFVFCLEPPHLYFPVEEFAAFAERAFPGRSMVRVSPEPLGCLRNTRQAIEMALTLSEEGFGVVAEEDLEVSDDIFEYLIWARDAYRDDPDVLTVCAHARGSSLSDQDAVTRAPWFCPLVWGTWSGKWDGYLKPAWGPATGTNNSESWDVNLQQFMQREQRHTVFPVRSRTVHRGAASTLLGSVLGEALYAGSVSNCYQPHYAEQQFHEIPYPAGKLAV